MINHSIYLHQIT